MSSAWTIDTTTNASVRICNQHASLRVHSRIHEIEQVAVVWTVTVATGRAQIADRTPLHGIGRGRINGGPCRAANERRGDVEMPRRALVVCSLARVIAGHCCAEECIRCTVVITSNDFRERRVDDPEKRADVLIVFPVRSLIMRHRNPRMSADRLVTEIDRVARLICGLTDAGGTYAY